MEDTKITVDGDSDNCDSQGTLPNTLELVGSPEVDTQPIEEKEEPHAEKHWGTLIPSIKNMDCIQLFKEEFIFGKSGKPNQRCHVIIEENHLPDTEDENIKIDKVSRIMFRVFKGRNVIGLEDLSKNGTYVNKLKVGNNNKQPLRDGDTIGILDENFIIYTFISENGPRTKFPSALCDEYLMGTIVGDGSTCVVHEAWRRKDGSKVAVKIINKLKWPTKYSAPSDLMKEVNILKGLDHPGIIKVLDLIETSTSVNIVMEFAEGGELFDQVQDDCAKEVLEEKIAKFQFYQICLTIQYLHSKNVCHRDLKLENLLLNQKKSKGQIKVTDFGLSKELSEKSTLETYVGTPIYIAPEIISSAKTGKGYDLKSDCWSLGVILYTLISGTPPFNQDLDEKFLNKLILSGNYCKMKGQVWDKVSLEGKDLVDALLTVDPKERPSASQILEHRWFTKDQDLCDEARDLLYSTTGKNAKRGFSMRKISNDLENLSVEQKATGDKTNSVEKKATGDKRAEPSSVESQELSKHKKPRVEADEDATVYVIDSD